MAIEIHKTAIYTVKFIGREGLEFKDIPATGMSDAQEKFRAEEPTAQIVNIWRKQ